MLWYVKLVIKSVKVGVDYFRRTMYVGVSSHHSAEEIKRKRVFNTGD